MKWFNYIIIVLLLSLVACQKESESIELTQLDIPVSSKVYDIVFLDETTGFACGGQLWSYGFILKTTDSGNNWEIIHESDNVLYSLALQNEQEIIAGGFSGRLWQTTDGGTNWILKEFGPDYIPITSLLWLNNEKVLFTMGQKYFTGGQGIYNNITGVFQGEDNNVAMQDMYAFNENEIIYCGYGYVLKSYDSGLSFESKNTANGFFKAIDFQENKGLLISYNGIIQYSSNKGETWKKIDKVGSTFTQNNKLEDVTIHNDKGIICGQDGVLYKNNIGSENLVTLENDFSDYNFYSVYLSPNGFAYVGSEGAIFKFVY